jgi:eukaryotic-like serine/threonine-protein kinase
MDLILLEDTSSRSAYRRLQVHEGNDDVAGFDERCRLELVQVEGTERLEEMGHVSSGRAGPPQNVYWQAADNTGAVERLAASPNPQFPEAISPDGTHLIVRDYAPMTDTDLRVLRSGDSPGPAGAALATPRAGGSSRAEPLVQTTADESFSAVSPDGHWLAYQSDGSDQFQISVRPFPNVNGGHWTISPSGGTQPVWARSGKELFYLDATNAVTAVPIHTTPTFGAGTPTRLFDRRYYAYPLQRAYDVSPDGQRFLMITHTASGAQSPAPASIVVVLNWVEELKRLVPLK